jgi:hypothetical protein
MVTEIELIERGESVDDELAIMECLEDYQRILKQVARSTVSQKRRLIASSRAQMVGQLIDRLKLLEDTDLEIQ